MELSWGVSYRIISKSKLSSADLELVLAAQEAAQQAYAPYSHFSVGAALRLQDGTIFTGNNQENAAYPSGLCAERVVLFRVGASGLASAIEALAVYAPKVERVFPCGACRQVMLEYQQMSSKPWRLIFAGGHEDVLLLEDAFSLLPFSFVWRPS